MNCDPTVVTAPCNFPPETNQGSNPGGPGGLGPYGGTPECGNPPGPDAYLLSVEVIPVPGFCAVGGIWQFTAIATYSDGNCANVTALASWVSNSPSIASVNAAGLATGLASGIATVVATWSGKSGFGTLDVALACHDIGMDICFVLPRDGAMLLTEVGQTRLSYVESGVLSAISCLDTATDQAAIVSYAGVQFDGGATQSDATIDCPLTNSQIALDAALQLYDVRGPCLFPDPEAGPNSRCEIGIGAGLQQAFTQLTGSGHVVGNNQLVILVADGRNKVVLPDPAAMAAQITQSGMLLMIVGINLSQSYAQTLGALATPGLFFNGSAQQAAGVIAQTAYSICANFYPYAYVGFMWPYSSPYGGNPYTSPPPPVGDPGGVAANLSGLSLQIPCFNRVAPSGCTCEIEPLARGTLLGGDPTKTYAVTLKITGQIEGNPYYRGGTPALGAGNGPVLYSGGGILGINPSASSMYWLRVCPQGQDVDLQSDALPRPSGTYASKWYYLNYYTGQPGSLFGVDYKITLLMSGGSSVYLCGWSVDGNEAAPPNSPQFFDGQNLRMDVLGVVQQ